MLCMNGRLLQILEKLKREELDLFSYLDGLCDEIEQIDVNLHCFVEEPGRRLRLQNEARTQLDRLKAADRQLPLFGLAIGVKDIIRTEGLETRCGSKLPPHLFAGQEASLVSRLKEAGAIVLGKTETTEFAWFQPGPTKNPINPQHTPGGSSSGSAAAVAAGLAPVALGTQTIGSVIRPAAYCGVVGVKPSIKSLPTDGIIPFSKSFDQPGFFTKDLDDAKLIASVICDEWTSGTKADPLLPHKKNISHQETKTPVVAIPDEVFLRQADIDIRDAFSALLRALEKRGVVIIKTKLFQNFNSINEMHKKLAAKEFADVHEAWYGKYGHLYSRHNEQLIMEGKAVASHNITLDLRSAVSLELESLMKQEGIDCWVSPAATSLPPKGLESTGSPLMNLPWTFTGVPCMSIPVNISGMAFPFGMQISGKMNGLKELFEDAEVLKDFFRMDAD